MNNDLRILVVDDGEGICNILGKYFSAMRKTLKTAG